MKKNILHFLSGIEKKKKIKTVKNYSQNIRYEIKGSGAAKAESEENMN